MSRWRRLSLVAALAPALLVGFLVRPLPVSAGGCNQWTGGALTSNWSDTANWTLGTPTNGQALCFPAVTGPTALTDDIAGLSVTGITFQASPPPAITGLPLTVASSISGGSGSASIADPIVLTGAVTVSGAITLGGPISGSGSLQVTHNWGVELTSTSNVFTGGTTVDGPTFGRLFAYSLGTGAVTVESGGELNVIEGSISNSISLAGSGLYGYSLGCYNGASFNGPITLTTDTTLFNYSAAGPVVVPGHICAINGVISGPFTLTLRQESSLAAGLAWDLRGANTYSGGTTLGGPMNDMGNVIAGGGSPLGTGPVTIRDGVGHDPASALHAGGTIGDVILAAPHGSFGADDGFGSPAHLVVGGLTLTSGALVSQLTSLSNYSTVESTGPISIGQATLRLDTHGFVPAPGTAFTLVRNTSGVPVAGSFAGLPEGAVFEAAPGADFTITYHGNNRGDIVVTAVAAVTVPSVGTSLVAGFAVASAGAVVLLLALPRRRRDAAEPSGWGRPHSS